MQIQWFTELKELNQRTANTVLWRVRVPVSRFLSLQTKRAAPADSGIRTAAAARFHAPLPAWLAGITADLNAGRGQKLLKGAMGKSEGTSTIILKQAGTVLNISVYLFSLAQTAFQIGGQFLAL
ncbi:hypothetical protein QUF75_16650 [Desulfococcaceae bacterium HSG7]|nr:hypothetical protein [Desulfococcaceae bacterium HSG7]